ncbi:hypothetical protein ACU6VI_18225 (plasmid) [Sphaerotilus natans]|uniref:hypothetical protein n=1 Tax=Sphaerotilus natans TaxID=34103 RepID=UPI00406C298B
MSSSSLNASPVAVLVSVRVDPVSGRSTRSRADAAGTALALQALQARATLQGQSQSHATQPRLLHAGCRQTAMPEAVARDYLALGVDRLERLELAGTDPEQITAALAEACRDTPLVIAGARGESGLASGLLPHRLAQRLQRPLIAEVIDLQPEADGGWRVVQALPRGARRSWRLARGAAAVLVSSERLARREDLRVRHAWLAAQQGRIEDRRTASGPTAGPVVAATPAWTPEPARRQRRPLAPVSTESGAARMARATGTAAPARQGGAVLNQGSAQDKARELLAHLRRLGLTRPPG